MKKRTRSPNIDAEMIHAGPVEGGFAGIDGQFMVDKDIAIAVIVTSNDTDRHGAIMLHPGFNPQAASTIKDVLEELNKQAQTILSAMVQDDGTVH